MVVNEALDAMRATIAKTLDEESQMSELIGDDVDVIKELRLRRWAREHYVAPSERSNTWHPLVLAEMQSKDAEASIAPKPVSSSSPYVPLAPSLNHVRHPGHQWHGTPKHVRETSTVDERIYS